MLLSATFTLLATLGVLRATAAPPLAALDRAADDFSVAITSRVLALAASTQTIHVAPFDPGGLAAEKVQLSQALQELLVQHLQGNDRIVLLDGTGASEKADLVVTGRIIDLDEGPEAFLRIADRKSSVLLLAAQEHIGPPSIRGTAGDASKKASRLSEVVRSSAAWVVSAGPLRNGEDVGWHGGWNASVAYRSISYPWEAALEGGGYEKSGNIDVRQSSLDRDALLSEASINYIRTRADYLYRIKHVRDPFGDELFKFPGHLRLGGGLGIYNFRIREKIIQLRNISSEENSYSETGSHVRLVPFIDAGIVRSIGSRLEISLAAQYVLSFEHFGHGNLNFGGPEVLLQLAYRFH